METLQQKKRRLAGKVLYLENYINIINRLTLTEIDPASLLSIVDSDKIYPQKPQVTVKLKTLKFEDKQTEWDNIKDYLGSNPVYLWQSDSHWCGLCPLESIDYFNIEFNYDDEPDGLIVLISSDGLKEVVLDFYEEDDIKLIDIEFRCVPSDNTQRIYIKSYKPHK